MSLQYMDKQQTRSNVYKYTGLQIHVTETQNGRDWWIPLVIIW